MSTRVLIALSLSISLFCSPLTFAQNQGKTSDEQVNAPKSAPLSREVILDPTRADTTPGQRFNQSQTVQFHDDNDPRKNLRDESITRRLDRLGRDRE